MSDTTATDDDGGSEAAYVDRAVYLSAGDALVVADLHVGRGEASDVEFPLGEATDLSERLAALLARVEPGVVVFAGDVLHQFSRVSDRVAESLDALTAACRDAGSRPVMVRGNHDTQLDSVWHGEIHDAYRIERHATPSLDAADPAVPDGEYAPRLAYPVVVRHGHESPPDSEVRATGTYLIGHDHPTLDVEGVRRPCYLGLPDAVRADATTDDGRDDGTDAETTHENGGTGGTSDGETLGGGGTASDDGTVGDGETLGGGGTTSDERGTATADAIQLPAFNRLPAGVTVNGMRASDFQSPFVSRPDDARPLVWDDDAGRVLPFPPLGEFRRLL